MGHPFPHGLEWAHCVPVPLRDCTQEVLRFSLNAVMVCVISLAFAGWFTISEDWNYGTALWFCWITATTIGYGDYVPQDTETETGQLLSVTFLMVCAAFACPNRPSVLLPLLGMLWLTITFPTVFCLVLWDVVGWPRWVHDIILAVQNIIMPV